MAACCKHGVRVRPLDGGPSSSESAVGSTSRCTTGDILVSYMPLFMLAEARVLYWPWLVLST